MRLQALAEELNTIGVNLDQPIRRLEKKGYVERFKGRYKGRQRTYVKITKEGRKLLRFSEDDSTFSGDLSIFSYGYCLLYPITDTEHNSGHKPVSGQYPYELDGGRSVYEVSGVDSGGVPESKTDSNNTAGGNSPYRGVMVYREALALWGTLKFQKVTVGHGGRLWWDKENKTHKQLPPINRNRPPDVALKAFVDKFRSDAEIFFTPAETWVGKGSVINFKRSRCLWLSFNLPTTPYDKPYSESKRFGIIVSKTQELIDDGFYPFAVIESGYDFQVLLLVQNYLTYHDRLGTALEELAGRYGADMEYAQPNARLRLPGTNIIEFTDDDKVRVKGKVRLIHYVPKAKVKMADIEDICEYKWCWKQEKGNQGWAYHYKKLRMPRQLQSHSD